MPRITDKTEWINAVADLKNKAAVFMELLNTVNRTGPKIINNRALRAERARLITRAELIKSTIEKVTGGIDKAYGIWDSTIGDNTFRADNAAAKLVPLIPVAAIAGATGAVAYWISNANNFLYRVYGEGQIDMLSTVKQMIPIIASGIFIVVALNRTLSDDS